VETPALDPRLPSLTPGIALRPARDPRRDAKQQAFEQAMARRGKPKAATASAEGEAGPTGPAASIAGRASSGPGISQGHDGLVHVDVVV
jgi:hypothetical protein